MNKKKIKVAILGATGFTGEKLVQFLLRHPLVDLVYLSSRTPKPISYSEIFPYFKNRTDLKCKPLDLEEVANLSDVVFCALPHTVSMEFVPYLLKRKKKVIDLSADYRIKDPVVYKKYYKKSHKDKKNLKEAVYGLPEFLKDNIRCGSLVANPGCYPVSILLPLLPLFKDNLITKEVFVFSLSSISGAGRKPSLEYHYMNIADNFWPYKPFVHQHIPEIVQIVKDLSGKEIELNFVPSVAPFKSGIYSIIYLELKKKVDEGSVYRTYLKYYKKQPFVRIRKDLPRLKNVVETNYCDIGFRIKEKRIVIFSCVDNLVKGAAGNAIQNMNIMLGFKETEGLI